MSKMTSKSKFATNWICLLLAGTLVCSGTLLAQTAEKPKRNLLFIGQAKGYQHEAISTAMATLYNLGRRSGLWNTQLRTDCTAITKKPLKWEAKNLDAFDAIVFFTDGDLDMDASQKADLLSFVRDDGKGFIGIHSAAITFTSWPEYGQMLGGYFDGHPWGQFNAPLVVEDSTFPGMNNFPATFTLFDEIYQIKDFSLCIPHDEIHHTCLVCYCERIARVVFIDDDSDLAAEFLVALFNHLRLIVEPRVGLVAHVQERHAGFGERTEIFQRRGFRHEAAQRGISANDASDLVRVFDRPGVGFARRCASAFHHRLFGQPVLGHELISGVPLRAHRAGLRGERRNNNVKTSSEQRLIHDRIASDGVGAEDPRFSGRNRPGHNDGEACDAPLA